MEGKEEETRGLELKFFNLKYSPCFNTDFLDENSNSKYIYSLIHELLFYASLLENCFVRYFLKDHHHLFLQKQQLLYFLFEAVLKRKEEIKKCVNIIDMKNSNSTNHSSSGAFA